MNYYLNLIVILLIIFNSCSKNEYENNYKNEDFEINNIINSIAEYIEEQDPSLEDFAAYFNNSKDIEKVDIIDNFVILKLYNGCTVKYDYYRYTSLDNSDLKDINDNIFQQQLDSIMASYPLRSDNLFNDNNIINKIQSSKSINKVILNERKAAIWCPWLNQDESTMLPICSKFKSIFKSQNKSNPLTVDIEDNYLQNLSDIYRWNNYDIIIVVCHGDVTGDIILPIDYVNELSKLSPDDGKQLKDIIIQRKKRGYKPSVSFILPKSVLNKLLPDLSHTIVWTSMCYAAINNSQFFNACSEKNVADYFGADNICVGFGGLREFIYFFPRLLSCKSSKQAFQGHFNYHYSYFKLIEPDKYEEISYNYKRLGSDSKIVGYRIGLPVSVRQNISTNTKSTASYSDYIIDIEFIYPEGWSSSGGEVLILTNEDSQEFRIINITDDNTVNVSSINYNDINIKSYEILVDDLIDDSSYELSIGEYIEQDEYLLWNSVLSFKTHISQYVFDGISNYKRYWCYSTHYSGDKVYADVDEDKERSLILKLNENGQYYIYHIPFALKVSSWNNYVIGEEFNVNHTYISYPECEYFESEITDNSIKIKGKYSNSYESNNEGTLDKFLHYYEMYLYITGLNDDIPTCEFYENDYYDDSSWSNGKWYSTMLEVKTQYFNGVAK